MIVTSCSKLLPFHVPLIEDDDVQAVVEVLRSNWITSGPKVEQFELAFANAVGARHAIAVTSCTAALHLALDAIGLTRDDEVLVPTLTFAATGEVVTYFGAKPVLVDSEPSHFNLDVDQLDRLATNRTRAIITVDFAGHPCSYDRILDFARRKGLSVIEDAAHAFPAKYRGRHIGNICQLTAFSFYATKTITTGEGGMVTTDDDMLASRIRLMRLHGMSQDGWKRYSAEGSWQYDILEAGYKYNLTDIQAALGLSQLAKAGRMRKRRAQIVDHYRTGLPQCRGAFRGLPQSPDVEHAWHLFVVLIEPNLLRISRDRVIDELRSRGIGTAVHFIPLHRHTLYKRQWQYDATQFPVAESFFQRCISLPLYPGMAEQDVDRVVDALGDIATRFAA